MPLGLPLVCLLGMDIQHNLELSLPAANQCPILPSQPLQSPLPDRLGDLLKHLVYQLSLGRQLRRFNLEALLRRYTALPFQPLRESSLPDLLWDLLKGLGIRHNLEFPLLAANQYTTLPSQPLKSHPPHLPWDLLKALGSP